MLYPQGCTGSFDPDYGGRICSGAVNPFLATIDTVAYDRVGNITYSLSAAATGSATYDKNRITSWPGFTFGHDSAGNVTSRTPAGGNPTYFYWSADGLLDSVMAGTRKIQYDYNAFGLLVRKRVNGTPARHFLWDQGHVLAELDGSDTLRVAEYAYYPGLDHPMAIMIGTTSITKTSYLQQDPLGHVVGAVTAGPSVDGAITVADPWGFYELTRSGTATSDTNRLRWKGLIAERDSTQLYYARARWYDPMTHRFMTQDPLGLAAAKIRTPSRETIQSTAQIRWDCRIVQTARPKPVSARRSPCRLQ